MKLNFNGKSVTPDELTKRIVVVVNDISRKRFTNLVERIYRNLTNIRETTRKLVQAYLNREKFSIGMPNMFTNLRHGNDIRHNMLLHIIYDLKKIDVNINPNKMNAKFTIPYGIGTDGITGTVKNSKGYDYAKALDSNTKFSRFNGFREKISTEYRRVFVYTFNEKYKGLADAKIYKY